MEYLFEKVTKLDHRGEFVTPEHFRKILPFDGDLYRSYYGYDKSILEHLESGKGIKDFRGVRMLPEIILDYDGHDNNLAEAFQQVQQAAYTMMHGMMLKSITYWYGSAVAVSIWYCQQACSVRALILRRTCPALSVTRCWICFRRLTTYMTMRG